MAGSVNKIILIGPLGADPVVRILPDGGRVVNLRIATSETWTDKISRERKERTEWHSISILSEGLVKVAEDSLKKGSLVYLEGQIEMRKCQDETDHVQFTTEIVLRPYRSELILLSHAGDVKTSKPENASLTPSNNQDVPTQTNPNVSNPWDPSGYEPPF